MRMKQKLIFLVFCVLWSGLASAAIYFNNATGDNSFMNPANWTGTIGTTSGDAVDVSGVDLAQLLIGETAALYTFWVGFNTGTDGEVVVDGGTLTSTRFIDVGLKGNGTVSLIDGVIASELYDINLGATSTGHGTMNMTGGLMTANRFFFVGEYGTGVMTMSGGTNSVTDYDFSIGNQAGASGALTMTGGHMDIKRDFIVGEKGVGVMTMSGGTINAGGVFRVAEVAGSGGQLNFSGGTIIASDFKIQSGTTSPGMVVVRGTAEIILPGNKVSTLQSYIDDGYMTGAKVAYDSVNNQTVVDSIIPPVDVGLYLLR